MEALWLHWKVTDIPFCAGSTMTSGIDWRSLNPRLMWGIIIEGCNQSWILGRAHSSWALRPLIRVCNSCLGRGYVYMGSTLNFLFGLLLPPSSMVAAVASEDTKFETIQLLRGSICGLVAWNVREANIIDFSSFLLLSSGFFLNNNTLLRDFCCNIEVVKDLWRP